jgi:hypothetical protein
VTRKLLTLPDPSPDVSEAIWEAEQKFGPTLAVPDQVALARTLGASAELTPAHVKAAFVELGLPAPSTAYAKAVATRVRGLVPRRTLLDVLLDFRKFAIRELSPEFGGKTAGREEQLKNSLLGYLPERGYREAHTGKGRMDIRIPTPTDAVIETKVWTTERAYRDGVEELARYVHTEQPQQAYIVVFGDRVPLPSILDDAAQERAPDEHLDGLTVPVVVVPFEVDPPSKAAREERRRERGQ